MPSIPVDVLLVILEHVDRADLATICQLNKICCSCSQDVLYRHPHLGIMSAHDRQRLELYQTLSQSTHLAKRVRSIDIIFRDSSSSFEIIAKALRNMSSLRSLRFLLSSYSNVLDGCTFKLHSFACIHSAGDSESSRNFLRNQTSLTDIAIVGYDSSCPIEATSLPSLTRVTSGDLDWVSRLIPGRSVSEVNITGYSFGNSADLSFFTRSTAPVQKLTIDSSYLYPKSGELLASIFPSLTDLTMSTSSRNIFASQPVRVSFYSFFIDLLCRRRYLTLTNGLKTCLLPWFRFGSLMSIHINPIATLRRCASHMS
jgi:hypothetical protein